MEVIALLVSILSAVFTVMIPVAAVVFFGMMLTAFLLNWNNGVEIRGFEVKQPTGTSPVPEQEEDDHG